MGDDAAGDVYERGVTGPGEVGFPHHLGHGVLEVVPHGDGAGDGGRVAGPGLAAGGEEEDFAVVDGGAVGVRNVGFTLQRVGDGNCVDGLAVVARATGGEQLAVAVEDAELEDAVVEHRDVGQDLRGGFRVGAGALDKAVFGDGLELCVDVGDVLSEALLGDLSDVGEGGDLLAEDEVARLVVRPAAEDDRGGDTGAGQRDREHHAEAGAEFGEQAESRGQAKGGDEEDGGGRGPGFDDHAWRSRYRTARGRRRCARGMLRNLFRSDRGGTWEGWWGR